MVPDPFARHNYQDVSRQTETQRSGAEAPDQDTVSTGVREDASDGLPHVLNKDPDEYTLEDKVNVLWETIFGG